MIEAALVTAASYLIGSIPVAWLAGRYARGVDLREYGSGNIGASNVWQSASRSLVVPVGLAQIAQGAVGPLIAGLLGAPDGVQVAAGLAAVLASNWNPWLDLSGGRGVGQAIGFLLVLSPLALVAFIVVAVAGVFARTVPQGVALALVVAPIAALASGSAAPIVAGCAALAALVLTKRAFGNERPPPDLDAREVWRNRLIYDRDIADREAWVRRTPGGAPALGADLTQES